jgi:peroxiredoxin
MKTPMTIRTWLFRWAIPLTGAGVLAWLAVPGAGEPRFRRIPVGSGQAPAWSMKDLERKTVSSDDFTGKVVLLNFWATWCPPCVREIPDLNQFYLAHASEGFVVVGASVENGQSDVVKRFVERRKIAYPVLIADEAVQGMFGGMSSTPMMPGGLPLPTTFVIGRDGRYVAHYLGALDQAELEKVILPLLRQPAAVGGAPAPRPPDRINPEEHPKER